MRSESLGRSVRRRLLPLGALAVLLSSLLAAGVLLPLSDHELADETQTETRETARALAPLLWNLDGSTIQAFLDTKIARIGLVTISVIDNNYGSRWFAPSDRTPLVSTDDKVAAEKITREGSDLGWVILRRSTAPAWLQFWRSLGLLLAAEVLLTVALAWGMTRVWNGVVARLDDLSLAVAAFADGDLRRRLDAPEHDDLGRLAQGFNRMAERLAASAESLEAEVRVRSERLIEAERLALIGSLVAGVAHEINTPVGNGITLTSWLLTRTRDEESRWREAPDKALTELFFRDLAEGLHLLSTGLNRTGRLVEAFKHIGSDQMVDEEREVDLAAFLSELEISLGPTLKHSPHRFVVEVPASLSVLCRPGTLYQILTNLILNAHWHAYAEDETGQILLRAARTQAGTVLVVEDEGRGMDDETRRRCFEPFFTTRRAEGGTGLGLAIVRNLVEQIGATVTLDSAPGRGTRFTVIVPKKGEPVHV